jgi:hypothetical protein
MSTSHLQVYMTAQEYLNSRLQNLHAPLGLPQPANDTELADAIFKIVMSKKYRKYAVAPEIVEHMKQAIRLNIKKREPINVTYFHGAYKLWRLDEAPEPDWAELFSAMYYTNWLRPICEIYEPGVWFDYFVDDLIVPMLNNTTAADQQAYLATYRGLFTFLAQYRPDNFKMTATGVGEQFASPAAFAEKLAKDVEAYAATLPGGLPVIDDRRRAMIDLNAKPTPEQLKDPQWHEKNTLMHDAYISMTKKGTGYHLQPSKILAFNQPLSIAMGVGTTRASIAKFWAGVGVLKPKAEDFDQIILSPSQLAAADYEWQPLNEDGLNGKNFSRIRILNMPIS